MEAEPNPAQKTYPWWLYSPIYLGPIILFLPALIPGRALFWGITSIQFIPWHWEALRMIQSGEFPLWNTLNGMGAPLAANFQSALFYPPTWLTLLAGWLGGIQWMAWSHGLLIVLHLIWAGWGMKKLTEFLGISPIPQVICGLSYGLCGYLVARGSFLTMVQAASWIPWILLAASQFAVPVRMTGNEKKTNTYSSILWLSLAFSGQWLSGHAQLAWYTGLFTLAWLITGAWINGGVKKLWQVAIPVALSGLLGFFLCSIQLLPTIEYFAQSQRSGAIDYQTALSYSFWPWRLITLIFPDIFGNPGAGDYWGYAAFWEDAIYFGLLPLFLAITYLFTFKKHKEGSETERKNPLVWFCLIAIGIILILALGWNTPVFPWLFANIPTFGFFNGPTRWMILVEVCLILLAGLGAEEWMKHGVIKRKWVNLGLTAAAAMILSAVAAWIFLPEIKLSFKTAVISSGVLLAGYLVLAIFKPKNLVESSGFHWRFLIILWLAVDLIWAGSKLNPSVSFDLYFTEKPQSGNLNGRDNGRYYLSNSVERDQRFKRFFVFEDIRPLADWKNLAASYLPNINILSGKSMVNNFDPMVPDRFTDYLSELETAAPDIKARFLALANVEYIAAVDPLTIQNMEWNKVKAYPRFRMVYCAEIVKDEVMALDWIRKTAADDRLQDTIVIESDRLSNSCHNDIPTDMAGLTDLSALSNQYEFEIKANPGDGWLFMGDTWYPGWQASLDGKPVEIYRVDYAFMGIRVPKGNHRIELSYRPVTFIAGISLSLLGLICVIVLKIFVKNSKGGSH